MTRHTRRRIRATLRQPLLTLTAKRRAEARAYATTMQLPCSACGATVAAHIAAGNRWKGCPGVTVKGGAR